MSHHLFFTQVPIPQECLVGEGVSITPVDHHHHFFQIFYHSLEFAQPFFRPLALGDVLHNRHMPNRQLSLGTRRCRLHMNPSNRAIRSEIFLFDFVAAYLPIPELPQLLQVARQVIWMRQTLEISIQQIFFRPPYDFTIFWIYP